MYGRAGLSTIYTGCNKICGVNARNLREPEAVGIRKFLFLFSYLFLSRDFASRSAAGKRTPATGHM